MKIVGFLGILAATISILFSSNLHAQTRQFRSGQLEVEAGSSLDVFGRKEEGKKFGEKVSVEDAFLRLKYNATRNIRFLLLAKFEADLRENGVSLPVDFDIEKFIWSAFIEIREVAGQPVALIVGKHNMAFGSNATRLPTEDAFGIGENLIRTGEVIGVTVRLDKRILNFLDTLEASIFETGQSDLGIGSIDGFAVRVSKRVVRNVVAKASYRYRGFGDDNTKNEEHTFGLAVVYSDGRWSAWVEGLGLVDNNNYPNANFALVIGVARFLSFGEVSGEFQFVENHFHAYRVGLKVPVTRNIMVGPEARYTVNNNGKSSFAIGARVKVETRTRINIAKKRETIAGKEIISFDEKLDQRLTEEKSNKSEKKQKALK